MTSLMWPRPLRVEHLERDQMCAPGRDAGARAVGIEAIAGDDAGDVRAVAVVVVRRRSHPCDEIDELAPRAGRPRRRRDRRATRDAGIDDRDADAGAVVAEILARRHRADGGAGPLHDADDLAIERHARDEGIGGQGAQGAVGHDRDVAADAGQTAAGIPSNVLDERDDGLKRDTVRGTNDDP